MANPFRIGDHVSGAFFTDRAAEVKRIVTAMREPTRLLVFGPRRMGKSSAIGVATEKARRSGTLVVRADLATASSVVDVANRLLHSLAQQKTREKLIDLGMRLAPHVAVTFDEVTGAPRLAFGLGQRRASEDVQRKTLEQVIEGLAYDAAEGQTTAVVLDEFQAIARLGGSEAEWHLRDLIQRHSELSFVCAGSEVSLIEEMIGKDRAFFRAFELLHLGPIESSHLGRWIDERLAGSGIEADGVGVEIIERAGPRTQDILQVARHLYSRGLSSGAAGLDDVTEAIDDVVREEDAVLRAIWIQLTGHQQNVLRAIAAGAGQIFSTATREHFGLPASSSVATAVDALIAKGIVIREQDRIGFDSPFFRAWVEKETLQDVPPI